jgi:hypothetical protein
MVVFLDKAVGGGQSGNTGASMQTILSLACLGGEQSGAILTRPPGLLLLVQMQD